MQLPRIFIVGVLLLGWSLIAGVASAGISVRPDRVALVPVATIVEDPTGTLTAEDVLHRATASGTAATGGEIASFGFSDAAYWFAVDLDNPTAAPLHRLLVIDPTWLDDVRVTLVRPDSTPQIFAGGDTMPFGYRAVPNRKTNFDLVLPPGQSRLLVRTQTPDPFLVGLTLWDRSAFFTANGSDAGYFGILYGAMGALLLFNLFLFFSVGEKVYGFYVTYLLGFLVAHASYNGHLYEWLWPNSPTWGNWAHSVFIYLFMFGGLFFTIGFLELRRKLPRAYRLAMTLVAAMAVSFLATAAFGGYRWHVRTSILWVVVYSPFVLLLGAWSLRAGNRAARYFLPATAAGFVGSLITALTVTDAIPFTLSGYRAVDFGILIDAILLSLALADRLRLARADADRAKAELMEAERSHTRELEETVSQRTRELSEANAVKDKFFTIVAHDLRGPIGGLATLFDKSVMTQADLTEDTLDIIRSSLGNTRDFLEELLTWARSQRGEIDCQPAATDLQSLLRETQQLSSAQAHAKGIHLDLDIKERCWVFADPAMTRTILRNLVQNAMKFTDSGGSVHASVTRDGDRCRVEISDTGVGMSDQVLNNLFRLDVKFRSSPGTRRESGTGLGLVLCKEFVERNGGAIGVQSEPGRGSTFWFSLPVADEASVPDLERLARIASSLNSLRILVVEDDRLHRDAAGRVLRELGCDPAFAADGAEAIRLVGAADFDLILMDIDLPDISGIDVARRIRLNGYRGLIASLSSYSRQEVIRMADEVRFDKFLYKPLTEDDAKALVQFCATADLPGGKCRNA